MNLQKIKKAASHLRQYGYAIIPNFIPPSLIQKAITDINVLLDNFDPQQPKSSIFDASLEGNPKMKVSNYFLDSVYKNGFFFEAAALKNNQLIVPKQQSINKIGHCMHEHYETFKQITYYDGAWELCQQIGIVKPEVLQSMAILKLPKIGGQYRAHQDSTFLYTEPDTLLGWWVPLEDATQQNSCLWGIPGSHRFKLGQRWRVQNGQQSYINLNKLSFKDEDFVPFQMKAGSLAIFTGNFVHRSYANKSNKSRYAYSWHIHDGSRSKLHPQTYNKRSNFIDFPQEYKNKIRQ